MTAPEKYELYQGQVWISSAPMPQTMTILFVERDGEGLNGESLVSFQTNDGSVTAKPVPDFQKLLKELGYTRASPVGGGVDGGMGRAAWRFQDWKVFATARGAAELVTYRTTRNEAIRDERIAAVRRDHQDQIRVFDEHRMRQTHEIGLFEQMRNADGRRCAAWNLSALLDSLKTREVVDLPRSCGGSHLTLALEMPAELYLPPGETGGRWRGEYMEDRNLDSRVEFIRVLRRMSVGTVEFEASYLRPLASGPLPQVFSPLEAGWHSTGDLKITVSAQNSSASQLTVTNENGILWMLARAAYDCFRADLRDVLTALVAKK